MMDSAEFGAECGQHGALFEIETGQCVDGPCEAKSLEPIAVAIIDGEVCLCGGKLIEDDGVPDPFNTPDDGPVVLSIPTEAQAGPKRYRERAEMALAGAAG